MIRIVTDSTASIPHDVAEENGIAFEPVEGADHRFQNPKHMDDAISRIAAFFGMK